MKSIKGNFTANYKKHYCIHGRTNLWQKRFWEQIIRSEKDLEDHLDYIHWNPVKHGLAEHPDLWVYSSFSDWVEKGLYVPESNACNIPSFIADKNFELANKVVLSCA